MRRPYLLRVTPPRKMAGLSLLEILVAMMIGLIGIVVITQVYIVNENYKRSTTSAGGAQSNGALALYTIEREARMAGWGISWSGALGCSGLQWYYNGAYSNPPQAGGTLPALTVAPIVITDGGAAPDTITIMYGSSPERVIPATLSATMTGPDLQLDNAQGISQSPGDLILMVSGNTCAMAQVTTANYSSGHIQITDGATVPYNPPAAGNLLPLFPTGTQIYDFGRPVVNVYSIGNQSLRVASLFTASSSTVVPTYTPPSTTAAIVRNIVDLQAEYGKDNGIDNTTVKASAFVANDGQIDSFDTVTPTTAAGWEQVLAVRIALLARSDNYEKPGTPGGPCTATTAAPTWADGTRTFNVPGGLPSCYRYRVFETIVPLRNMIWRQG